MNVDVFMMCVLLHGAIIKKMSVMVHKKAASLGLYSHEKANVSYKMFTVIIDEKPLTN